MEPQERKYAEPQSVTWKRYLPALIIVAFALLTLTIIPIAGALGGSHVEEDAAVEQQAKQVSLANDSASQVPVDALEPTEPNQNGDSDANEGGALDIEACTRTVTYQVYNGWWNDGSGESITQEVVLKDGSGNPSVDGKASLSAPSVGSNPAPTYMTGAWNIDPAGVTFTKDSPTTYTYTYAEDHSQSMTTYTIEYYFDGSLDGSLTVTREAKVGDSITLSENDLSRSREHAGATYALAGNAGDYRLEVDSNAGNNVIKVYYDMDMIGSDGGPDGIADKYQMTITYKVVNGYWIDGTDEDKYEVVTLTKGDAFAEDGTAKLQNYPGVGINPFDGFMEGDWDADIYAIEVGRDSTGVFTYTYKTSNLLSYTVNYLEQGTNKVLATSKTVYSQVLGSEVSESAVAITGYDVVAPESATITIGSGQNVINFYYTVRNDLSYTVKYLERGTGRELVPVKTVDAQTFGTEVSEQAPAVDGYTVDMDSKTATITTGTNEIAFYYAKRTDLSYTVNYYDDENNVMVPQKVVRNQAFGSRVTEEAPVIDGYTVDLSSQSIDITTGTNAITFTYTKRKDLTYTVKYLDERGGELMPVKTVDGQTFGTEVNEQAPAIDGYIVDADSKTATITTGTNEITFTYTKRNDLSYTVKYLDGQGAVLSEQKTVTGQTFDAVVTEYAIAIEGYTADASSKTATITTGTNEIVFTYAPLTGLSYTVNYYRDSVSEANRIGDPFMVGGQTFGDRVTLTDQLTNARVPVGYARAAIPASFTIGVGDNSVDVVYAKDSFAYTVEYYFDGVKDMAANNDGGTAVYGSTASVNPDSSTMHDDQNYVLVSSGHQVAISADPAENVIKVYYEKDEVVDPSAGSVSGEYGDGIPDRYQVVINYVSEEGGTVSLSKGVVTIPDQGDSGRVSVFAGVTASALPHFVFDGWVDEDGNVVADDAVLELQGGTERTFTARWAADAIGVNPDNPGDTYFSDGIPDKYQILVTYAAINGTVDGTFRYVLNKVDANGELAEDGTAILTAAQIPATSAAEGYGPEGSWGIVAPVAGMELSSNTVFTITYTAIPEEPTPGPTPDDEPSTPVTPPDDEPTTPEGTETPGTPTTPGEETPGAGTPGEGTPGEGTTPTAPFTPQAPALVNEVATAAAPMAAVAAIEALAEDGNPLGSPEVIDDDANALAAFESEEPAPWTYVVFGGAAATALVAAAAFGVMAVRRRGIGARVYDASKGSDNE